LVCARRLERAVLVFLALLLTLLVIAIGLGVLVHRLRPERVRVSARVFKLIQFDVEIDTRAGDITQAVASGASVADESRASTSARAE
jgi:hypothetical protein